ncbi:MULTISPECIES: hypothetical protein [Streptacidiphilus]|uniref:Uncharacterized protein n=1 Tax=Streptacidiphilus cavernicola TaxID=3342716 RepID=A0ABV6UW31_9ACTN|nr:hypothetical protein [Streptacidiphilus jeojiense]
MSQAYWWGQLIICLAIGAPLLRGALRTMPTGVRRAVAGAGLALVAAPYQVWGPKALRSSGSFVQYVTHESARALTWITFAFSVFGALLLFYGIAVTAAQRNHHAGQVTR